jgi:hypothetical protein
MVFNGTMCPRVYFTDPNIHNDENLTITIIHHVISHWSSNLPEVLYLELDNSSCENKNQIMFGHLSMLVELGIFEKVKVGFLLLRHTHHHIDQIFSHFSITLKRENVGILPSLIECIEKSYIPEPIFHILEENVIEYLNYISFQHQFFLKKVDGKTLIWGNKH